MGGSERSPARHTTTLATGARPILTVKDFSRLVKEEWSRTDIFRRCPSRAFPGVTTPVAPGTVAVRNGVSRIVRLGMSTALAAAVLVGCGDSDEPSDRTAVVEDPGRVRVHGIGVNPADGALFVATHTGLFRVPPGQERATRVADRFQDTMGFTVTGPDRFLGSGHPDGREDLPPFLGLIRSTDAGRSWKPVSLLGKRDFHVREAAGPRVYGYGSDFDSERSSLLVSDDHGRTWQERTPPEPLISLAIHPSDPTRIVASGERGTYASDDAADSWRPLGADPGLLAWSDTGTLFVARPDGWVSRSTDAGATWEMAGNIEGQPAAFESAADELFVALHDGTTSGLATVRRPGSCGATLTPERSSSQEPRSDKTAAVVSPTGGA